MFHGEETAARQCATCTNTIAPKESYIGCNYCFMWFHVACLGKTSKGAIAKLSKLSEWFCSDKCKQQSVGPKSMTKGTKLVIPDDPTVKDLCQLLVQHMEASRADIDRVTRIIVDNDVKHTREIRYLRSEVNQLKQQQLQNNVIVSGFSLKPDTDPTDTVIKIFDVLGQQPEPYEYSAELVNEHRQKNKQQGGQQQQHQRKQRETISLRIVFSKRQVKKYFLEAIKEHGPMFANEVIGGECHDQLYVREELTAYYNKLAFETRKLKKELNFQYCWFKDSRILLRKTTKSKIYSFRSFEDLDAFKIKYKEITTNLDESNNSVIITN
jgi:hypothetical protein